MHIKQYTEVCIKCNKKTIRGSGTCQQYIYEGTLQTLNLFACDTAYKQCLAFHEKPSKQGTANH